MPNATSKPPTKQPTDNRHVDGATCSAGAREDLPPSVDDRFARKPYGLVAIQMAGEAMRRWISHRGIEYPPVARATLTRGRSSAEPDGGTDLRLSDLGWKGGYGAHGFRAWAPRVRMPSMRRWRTATR